MSAHAGKLFFQTVYEHARVDRATVIRIAIAQITDDAKVIVGQFQTVLTSQFNGL